MRTSSSSPALLLFLSLVFILGLLHQVKAQNQTRAAADPDEARVVNSIFRTWGVKAQKEWNISGELCSGVAIDESVTIDDTDYDPFIKCDCSYKNSTLCRITALKVYALDVQGPIPEELWTLIYLTNLNLAQNFLTGPLSPGIGNLTRMQWLTFGINALSGPIPKEIGQLTDLRSVGLAGNNFSGPIPPELGNCLSLQQLYIGGPGLTGPIPSTFANLKEMVTVWATDMPLTGRVPDFIGNWSKLTTLRIQGTSLSGPIPSSFANLTSLTELRIGDLSNGSSSLEFIKDMKSLTVLMLRNNNMTGTIPSNIGEYLKMQQLDLSFNNISGTIPKAVFNLSSLTHLFLGNNSLTGSLPAQKSPSLLNVDLSYNNLVGSIPSWASQSKLQLNLVANNFTLTDSDNKVLPGLSCLQKNFPCNRGTGIYFNFSVKCGGPQIRTASGAVFEKEDEALGPASYFVSNTQRWGVSNVGLFTGSTSNRYTASSLSQFPNTLDTELFQSARLSASSLRYYGLGLENGNYTVRLQFAEIVMQNSNTWRALGRRVFDIYVQGKLVEKDFDIRRLAGASFRAAQREYKTNVSENHLEVHLFWAGKGTCCIPTQGTYGPLISAVSATPDFIPTVGNKPPSEDDNKAGLIAGVVIGVGVASFLAIALFFVIRRRRRRARDEAELLGFDTRPFTFSYSELKIATQDFSPTNKLGEGGFGPVYKGKLNDGREVAVKQLSVTSRQGKGQFIAEIATISAVQHRNLVKLYGCCLEGDQRLLVYEYLPNKSLDQALFGQKSIILDWSTRFEICMGVARGLAYLHEESRLRIVHRDVKASNILLDADLVPKISDFGMAKLYDDDKQTHMSTRVAGTFGYLAPEYAMRGHLTEKTDVFAFGVVALEIVSGRSNSDQNLEDDQKYLLEWVWQLHEQNRVVELVDSKLTEFNEEEVKRMIGVAQLCTHASHGQRPQMSRVIAMLSGDVEVASVTTKPSYLTDWRFEDITSFVSEAETKQSGDVTTFPNSSSSQVASLSTSDVAENPSSGVIASTPSLRTPIGEGR